MLVGHGNVKTKWKCRSYVRCWLTVLMVFVLLGSHRVVSCQIAYGGTPYGYALKSASAIPFLSMPYVDNEAMIARDAYSWDKSGPFMFGEKTRVNLGLDNSGVWRTLENGDRIWNLGIRSSAAYSTNLIFSESMVPFCSTAIIHN